MTNPMTSRRSVLAGGAALAAVGFVADPALADVSGGGSTATTPSTASTSG